MTAPSPIVIPGSTVTFPPIHTALPIVIGCALPAPATRSSSTRYSAIGKALNAVTAAQTIATFRLLLVYDLYQSEFGANAPIKSLSTETAG